MALTGFLRTWLKWQLTWLHHHARSNTQPLSYLSCIKVRVLVNSTVYDSLMVSAYMEWKMHIPTHLQVCFINLMPMNFSRKSLHAPYCIPASTASEFGTYRLCEQRRFRRACASAQPRQNLRCSLIQAVSQEEPSDRKPDPWPLWMAGHAQLKFVMTECSKTQIRLTGLI